MIDPNDDGPLLRPVLQAPADQLLLPEPLPTLPPEAAGAFAALAPHVEALADLGIRALTPPAAAPAAGSRGPQALLAGLMQGLGAKYQDQALSQAGLGLEQRLMTGLPAAASKPTPAELHTLKGKPKAGRKGRRTRAARNNRKGDR